ncbi:MAG: CRTAC1 family protein [Acidobacteriota bacterium]
MPTLRNLSVLWLLFLSLWLAHNGLLWAEEALKALFVEIPPTQSGIHWVHENARSEKRYLPETLGPGCAFFDFDSDGWMDIYLVNYGPCDFFQPSKPIRSALYRNKGDGSFEDVTIKAGVAGNVFGMGAVVGDYDNDGWPDLLVTAYDSHPLLYRNNGDGTFSDVSSKAGVVTGNWTTSGAWFDYDNDGHLDLFLCSFVQYGLKHHIFCGDNKMGRAYYCIPRVFNPTPSYLFHNNGDGTFTDVSKASNIAESLGKALGVVVTDINNDGLMDLFVANDTVQNFLFVNRGQGKFEETGLMSEVAYSEDGRPRSGMGVDSADFNNDGFPDLFVANVDQEKFSIYQNNKDETFRDQAMVTGIGQATLLLSGWGLKFFDYDIDGFLDLFLANGHPDDMVEINMTKVTYEMPLLLFRQDAQGFHNLSDEAGPAFRRKFPARGMAVGDYDNDGRLDVLVANNGEPPLLLHNNTRNGHHWVGVRLVGSTCNRDAIGARLTWSAEGEKKTRFKASGGSYLSSHDPREILGLGKAQKLDSLEIKWPAPSGKVERFTEVPTDRYFVITEGKGIQ